MYRGTLTTSANCRRNLCSAVVAIFAVMIGFALVAPGIAQAATPALTLSPASGSPGTGETISGSGWTAGDSIFIQIGSTTFDTDVVCALTASQAGTIAGTGANGCVVPNVQHGSEPLVAIDEQHQSIVFQSTFAVTPSFTVTPANAGAGAPTSPGTVVTAVGHGFAPSSTVSKFKFDGVAVTTSPASVSTDANGNAAPVTFTIPSSATAGVNTLTATDASGFVGTQTVTIYRATVTLAPATGSPGTGETISGAGWPAGDSIFVQIGSTSFDSDVVCALQANGSGVIAGSSANGCVVPDVAHGSQPLVGIDEQKQGVVSHGTYAVTGGFTVTPTGAGAGAATSPGSVVTAVGHGFKPLSTVSGFKFDGTAVTTSPASVSTDANGNAAPVTFTIPSTAVAGVNTLTATDSGGFVGTQKITVYRVKATLAPATGSPGTGETITGSGWPAGDQIFIQIGSTSFDTDVVCAVQASSTGTLAAANNCSVPDVAHGSEPLVAIDEQQQGVVYHGTYAVTGGFTLTPAGAGAGAATSPGSVVTAVGHGFAPVSTLSNFKFDGVAVAVSPTSVSTDANGNAAPVTFTIPSTAVAGVNTLTATDGSGFVGTQKITVYRVKVTLAPAQGAPGTGETISGTGWPAGDTVFIQIGSTSFDSDVVCALTASSTGTIAGTQANGCVVPDVLAGTEPLAAIDEQQQGIVYHGTFKVT